MKKTIKIKNYKIYNFIDGTFQEKIPEEFPNVEAAKNYLYALPEEVARKEYNINQRTCLVGFSKDISRLGRNVGAKISMRAATYLSSLGKVVLSKPIKLGNPDKEWDLSDFIDENGMVECKADWVNAVSVLRIPDEYADEYSPELLLVNHIDGNNNNNDVDNLEWYMYETDPGLIEESNKMKRRS